MQQKFLPESLRNSVENAMFVELKTGEIDEKEGAA